MTSQNGGRKTSHNKKVGKYGDKQKRRTEKNVANRRLKHKRLHPNDKKA
jgi:hypothetical protein